MSSVTVNSLESIDSGINSSAYGNEDIYGGTYGAGIRYTHETGFVVKLETVKTEFQNVKLKSTTGNKNTIKARPESSATRLAIGFKF